VTAIDAIEVGRPDCLLCSAQRGPCLFKNPSRLAAGSKKAQSTLDPVAATARNGAIMTRVSPITTRQIAKVKEEPLLGITLKRALPTGELGLRI